MGKKLFLILFLVLGFELSSQTAISGFVDAPEVSNSKEKIYLTKLTLKDMPSLGRTKAATTTSTINKEGRFEFKRDLIDEKESVYKLYVNRFDHVKKDTIQVGKLFLFSKKDTIFFKKSSSLLSKYSNTNAADKEWQGLRNYESNLNAFEDNKEVGLSDSYVNSLKSYTKDSLQILIVKLISIKQLENKNLLDKDILNNKQYYLELLAQLEKSDIDQSEYLFLENKLVFLTTEIVENKYHKSKIAILVLVLTVFGLIILVFKVSQRKLKTLLPENNLSRQERNIQRLILEGKSNKEIGNQLFISLSTVKTHISNIYNKLGVSDRRELIHRYQN